MDLGTQELGQSLILLKTQFPPLSAGGGSSHLPQKGKKNTEEMDVGVSCQGSTGDTSLMDRQGFREKGPTFNSWKEKPLETINKMQR